MTLFITHDNRQLGPFSLPEVQGMLATGAVAPADLAWYEGLADWIPLDQVPGINIISTAPAGVPDPSLPSPKRPVLVWVICLIYFACLPFAILGLILIYFIANGTIPIQLPDDQRQLLVRTPIDDVIQIMSLGLNLAWSVQLFRLKRQAILLFAGSMALGLVTIVYHAIVKGHMDLAGPLGMTILAVCWVLNFLFLWYMWNLARKGVLR